MKNQRRKIYSFCRKINEHVEEDLELSISNIYNHDFTDIIRSIRLSKKTFKKEDSSGKEFMTLIVRNLMFDESGNSFLSNGRMFVYELLDTGVIDNNSFK